MRVGVVQPWVDPRMDRMDDNRRRLQAAAGALFAAGARLVVLPELAASAYFPASLDEVRARAEAADGPSYQGWHALCRQYGGYLVGGILEAAPEGLFNTALVVGPEGLVGRYRKTHLFAWERRWLSAGWSLPVWPLPDLGVTLGVLICYDLRFPEAVRTLALAGCQLLAVPATWTSIGKRRLWDAAGYCPQDHNAIGHAYCNRLAVVCANRVGREGAVDFLGASLAVDPSGEVVLGPLPGRVAASAWAELKPASDRKVGDDNDLWADRRPGLYRLGGAAG